jgi:hypothetical protein
MEKQRSERRNKKRNALCRKMRWPFNPRLFVLVVEDEPFLRMMEVDLFDTAASEAEALTYRAALSQDPCRDQRPVRRIR